MTMNYATGELDPGECAYGCGNLALPDGELCADCAAVSAEADARHAKSEQRAAAREENARRLAALPPCDCVSEVECQIHIIDWHSMSKSRANKLYRELDARCQRYRRINAEGAAAATR
jgi:hypothetical protein